MIPITKLRTGTLAMATAGLLSGCSVNPGGAFQGVRDNVFSRTGDEVLWVRSTEGAVDAASAVRSLLRKQLTADSAAQIALLNNRRLQAEFEEIGIAQADYVQAGLLSNPEFTASVRWPHRPPSGPNSEFSVAQNFIDLLLLPLRKNVAARELDLAKLRVSGRILEFVANTKIAFYNLQAKQQLLRNLQVNEQANETAADLAKKIHEAGNIPDLDLANQQALYTQSRVDVSQTEAQIRAARERLNRLMGVWGKDVNWETGDQLPAIPAKEAALANLEKTALEHRLDVAAARLRVEAAALSLGLTASTRLLPVGVDAGVNTERETGAQRTGPTLSLRLPVFDQGKARLARSQSQYRQAQREYEALAVEARSEVREARALVTSNRELARYYKDVLLPQREQVVNQTQLHYNVMGRGPFELITTKERLMETGRDAIEAVRDYWIARVELQQALLGGSPRGAAGEGLRDRRPPRDAASGEAEKNNR